MCVTGIEVIKTISNLFIFFWRKDFVRTKTRHKQKSHVTSKNQLISRKSVLFKNDRKKASTHTCSLQLEKETSCKMAFSFLTLKKVNFFYNDLGVH